jgi:hypothetical protein
MVSDAYLAEQNCALQRDTVSGHQCKQSSTELIWPVKGASQSAGVLAQHPEQLADFVIAAIAHGSTTSD